MLFHKRAIDIAGTSNKLQVFFNDVKIEVSNFRSYINLYYTLPNELYFDNNDRWSIGVFYKPDAGGEVISFVNSINTYKGGTHCAYIIDNIIKILLNDYIKEIIDIHQYLKEHSDPLSLFPFRRQLHYNEKGYKFVAEKIYDFIKFEK